MCTVLSVVLVMRLFGILIRLLPLLPPDDGKLFHGSGVGDAFGPRCLKGDIMGCGIMFPRDYILDGEGEVGDGSVGTSLTGPPSYPSYLCFMRRMG